MSSHDDVKVEPHILQYLSQIEEPARTLSSSPIDTDSLPKPRLKRKLSEPSHKLSAPLKPILKGRKSITEGQMASSQSTTHHQLHLQPSVKNNVPLSLDSKKSGDQSNLQEVPRYADSPDSADELFYTPGSVASDVESESKPGVQDYLSASKASGTRNEEYSSGSGGLYQDPPTPITTPALRSLFSQPLPFQGYPPTRRNTIRRLRRRTPPIFDEFDRQRNFVQFPSRQSFTFSAPTPAPSPCAVPLQPPEDQEVPSAANEPAPMKDSATSPQCRMSWRPNFIRRSQTKASPERRKATRSASKRKSVSDSEGTSKRRKIVQFALPQDHKEHPPMRRRPTPYYESFSIKVKRLLRSLFSRFNRSEEGKERRKAAKAVKKAAKKARMAREELEYSYRNFDDTID